MNMSPVKSNWADGVALYFQADAISSHPAEQATPDLELFWPTGTHGSNYV